jgi:hypothetical protein
MAYEYTTFKIIADFAKGNFIDRGSTGVNPPTGYVGTIPDLWVGNEYELVIYCYEYYATSGAVLSEFGTLATAKLYIKRLNSNEDPVTLDAAGTVTQSIVSGRYDVLTFKVAADVIPATLADQDCLLYAEVTATGKKRTVAQRLRVNSNDGNQAANLYTKDVDVSTLEYDDTDSPVTLTAQPGLVAVLLDTSAGDITLNLPAAAAESQQELLLVQTSNTGTVTIVGTVNGNASPVLTNRVSAHLVSDGTSWHNLNYTVVLHED